MDLISPQSYWYHGSSAPARAFPKLEKNLTTDVVIIGAGITGLTAAMHLKAAGKRVVVLEAGRVSAGTTGGTTGHLDAHPDHGAQKLIRDFGIDAARLVVDARMSAIDDIESWSRSHEIDCDFQRVPAYLFSETLAGVAALRDEGDALRELGLDVSHVAEQSLPVRGAGGYRIANQARFHSVKYLAALAERLHHDGCEIHEHTPARPPQEEKGITGCVVETPSGKVAAQNVLVCTHSVFLGLSVLDVRIAPYQSYVLTARVAEQIPDALYWDDASPYHYIRLASSDDPHLLMIGGCDHKTGQGGDESEAWSWLERYARHRFTVERIEQRWSAEFFEPADGLPYIGRVPLCKHLYVATGYSGTGLTFGTVAGRLLADQVLGRMPPIGEVLSPARLMAIASGKAVLTENLNAAKHFVADRFAGNEIASLQEVRAGEGRLVHYGGRQLAVFRETNGAVHALSPVCTHMGCHVSWNEAEQTWDCPCHGGRFSPTGERLYGPPARNLEVVSLDKA